MVRKQKDLILRIKDVKGVSTGLKILVEVPCFFEQLLKVRLAVQCTIH